MKKIISSVFPRLVIAVLLVILAPLYLTQAFIYNWSRVSVTDELYGAAASNVLYLRDNFEKTIHSAVIQLEYLLNSETVFNFHLAHIKNKPSEIYTAAVDLIRSMRVISGGNEYVNSISVYFLKNDVMLSSRPQMTRGSNAQAEKLTAALKNGMKSFIVYDNAYTVAVMSPNVMFSKDAPPVYLASAAFDETQIRSHLSAFADYNNKNAFILNHGTGSILTAADITEKAAVFAKSIDIDDFKTDNGEVYILNEAGKNHNGFTAFAVYSPMLGLSFVQLVPDENLNGIPDRLRAFMLFFSALSVLIACVFGVSVHYLVKRPVNDLVDVYQKLGDGSFDIYLEPAYSFEYNQLALGINKMAEQLRILIQKNYEQTIYAKEAELKQFQSQINPHFLYNSFLFLRQALSSGDNGQSMEFLMYLSRFYEYLANNKNNEAPLREEYAHAVNYISIQAMRFDGLIETDIGALPERLGDIRAPRLILQPLLENIIKHGLRGGDNTEVIKMGCTETGDGYTRIYIENSGDLNDGDCSNIRRLLDAGETDANHLGLQNINKRLKLFYGDHSCGLTAAKSPLGGLRVVVALKREDGVNAPI